MCYVTIRKPEVKFQVEPDIFPPGYRPNFEIRSAKFSVFGWDDGHHPGFENRPDLFTQKEF